MFGLAVGAVLAVHWVQPVNELFPTPGDFRFQPIRKTEGEKDWPFVREEGRLACVMSLGKPIVYFFPPYDGTKQRPFVLSVNLVEMGLTNFGMSGVLTPYDSYEELITRIAPFIAMGQMLCKYKDGPVVPGSEL